jgi:acyl-coenzyme A thioesterase PaaI-like protein
MRSAFKQSFQRLSSWANSDKGKAMVGRALAVGALLGTVSATAACSTGKPIASDKLPTATSAALDRFGAQVAAEHFSTTSHYTGPPMPPVRPNWSESAEGLFTELTEQGYTRIPPMFCTFWTYFVFSCCPRVRLESFCSHIHPITRPSFPPPAVPNSFVVGGHGLEHRLQTQLFYKSTGAESPSTGTAAAPSSAASTAVTDPALRSSIALDGFEPEDAVLLLRGVATMGPHASGYPGYVHGGCIASIFDSAAGQAVSLSGIKAMTGNLSIDYRRPVPLHTEVELLVAVSAVHGRKARVKFALCDLPEKRESGTPALVYSEGTALFVVPRAWAAANAKPVPVA